MSGNWNEQNPKWKLEIQIEKSSLLSSLQTYKLLANEVHIHNNNSKFKYELNCHGEMEGGGIERKRGLEAIK